MAQSLRRAIQIFVLFGIPALAFVYAYQFIGQDRETVVPFKPFKIPATALQRPDARAASLQLRQPITAVSFWASWCPPCVEEFPAMVELQRQMEGKGFEILFVSVDEKWSDVERFFAANNVRVPAERLYWDPSKKTAADWGSSKFPETYVVRRDGWVVEKIIGAQLWTRPAVLDYFTDLAKKFEPLKTAWSEIFGIPEAFAEGTPQEPLLHEDDRKSLEKMHTNIGVASQNLQNAEAALKEENRNLEEVKASAKRRQDEEDESEKDLAKLKAKREELHGMARKNENSLQSEQRETKALEGKQKESEKRIAGLEKSLEQAKDELAQIKQQLNTRNQQVGTFSEADKSLGEESKGVEERIKAAQEQLETRKKATGEAQGEIRKRDKRSGELKAEVAKAKAELEKQTKKLEDFEKILKR